MNDRTIFQLTVSGPPDEQAGLRTTIEQSLRIIESERSDPEYAFDVGPDIWGEGTENDSFIVQSWHHEYEDGERIFEPVPIREVNGTLVIEAETEGKPPIAFVKRASWRHPALSFELIATIGDKRFERWQAQTGALVQLEERVFDLETGNTIRWIKDGKTLT